MPNADQKGYLILGLRILQLLTIGICISGFVWGSGDYLLATVLVDAPVTPLSVLMILYGFVGSLVIEATVRLLSKQPKN